jgi:hypothetical protein
MCELRLLIECMNIQKLCGLDLVTFEIELLQILDSTVDDKSTIMVVSHGVNLVDIY